MKVYVRAPYEEACLAELKELFDEVVYEPWTTTGQRYYEDEMLEHLLAVQPDALITELDRVTEKVLAGYDRLKFIGDCPGHPRQFAGGCLHEGRCSHSLHPRPQHAGRGGDGGGADSHHVPQDHPCNSVGTGRKMGAGHHAVLPLDGP